MNSTKPRAAFLGLGVMGSGIAAHVANAGIPVLMLDMVPPEAGPNEDRNKKSFRNKFALAGLANLKKLRPAPLFTPAALDLIEVGNFDYDLKRMFEDIKKKEAEHSERMAKIRPAPPLKKSA